MSVRGAEFTKKMKETHTIFLPDMLGYHNKLIQAAFLGAGYRLEIMSEREGLASEALPYISGDYCLPAMMILGQMLKTVQTNESDINHIAFMEPQTNGACRAGNYYHSMVKCLNKAGYPYIPVISLGAFGKEKQKGFSITAGLIMRGLAAVCYGDLLMTLLQQIRPYEKEKGKADACFLHWQELLTKDIKAGKNLFRRQRKKRYREIIESFLKIETEPKQCRKVGVTGEIYMKFSRIGNEDLETFLKEQNCAYGMNGFFNYLIYLVDSEKENEIIKGKRLGSVKGLEVLVSYLEGLQLELTQALEEQGFSGDASFRELKETAKNFIDLGCNTGDGWLIAGEVADLVKKGYDHILILHPFGCLVSHVCERGILKKLRDTYKEVSIQTIEYDYDASKTLRESRILLAIE